MTDEFESDSEFSLEEQIEQTSSTKRNIIFTLNPDNEGASGKRKRDSNIPWNKEQLQLLFQFYNKASSGSIKKSKEEIFKEIAAELSLQRHFVPYTPINPNNLMKKFNREKKTLLQKYSLDNEGSNLSGLPPMEQWENILYKILEKEYSQKHAKEEETRTKKLKNLSMLVHEQQIINDAQLNDPPVVLNTNDILDAMNVMSNSSTKSNSASKPALSSKSSSQFYEEVNFFDKSYDEWVIKREKAELDSKLKLAEEEMILKQIQEKRDHEYRMLQLESQIEAQKRKDANDEKIFHMMTSFSELVKVLAESKKI